MTAPAPKPRDIPPAAIACLGELLPANWSFAQVERVLDWAAALVEAARAEETARIHAALRGGAAKGGADYSDPIPVPAVVVEDRPAGPRRPGRARRPAKGDWTPGEDATLLRMLAEARTSAEIGAAVGRSTGAAKARIQHLRRRQDSVPSRPLGRQITDASREIDRRVAEMARAGHTEAEIATALDLSRVAVRSRIKRLRWAGGDLPDRRAAANRRRTAGPAIAAPQRDQEPVKKPAARAVVLHEPARGEAQAPLSSADGTQPVVDNRPAQPCAKSAPVCQPPAPPQAPAAPAPAATDAALAPWAARIAIDINAPPRPIVARAMAHLDRLPPDPRFAEPADLRLLVEVCGGRPSAEVAAELGVTPADLGARFRAMLRAELRGLDGRLSIAGREVLLEAAKRNAAVAG